MKSWNLSFKLNWNYLKHVIEHNKFYNKFYNKFLVRRTHFDWVSSLYSVVEQLPFEWWNKVNLLI